MALIAIGLMVGMCLGQGAGQAASAPTTPPAASGEPGSSASAAPAPGGSTSSSSTAAADNASFPAGPGRDTFLHVCSQCHSPQEVLSNRQDGDGWASTLNQMIQNGAQGSNDDFTAIYNYLTTYFNLTPPPSSGSAAATSTTGGTAAPSPAGSAGGSAPVQPKS